MADLDDNTPALQRLVRDPWVYLSATVVIVAGYFGLSNAGGLLELGLRAVSAAAGFVLLVRLAYFRLLDRLKRVQRRFNKLQEEFVQYKAGSAAERAEYRRAIERLVEPQALLYEEILELTVIVGIDSADDRVIEKHITTPNPTLIYRSMRPITPTDTLVPLDFEDLKLEAKLAEEEDGRGVELTPFPLVEWARGVRTIILFEPPVKQKLAWTLSYHSRGLWDTLRSRHADRLAWDARSPSGKSLETTFTKFTVRFVFPRGASGIVIREQNNRGEIVEDDNYRLGPSQVWTDNDPEGIRYVWDISIRNPS